jgi:hypothetical protein
MFYVYSSTKLRTRRWNRFFPEAVGVVMEGECGPNNVYICK